MLAAPPAARRNWANKFSTLTLREQQYPGTQHFVLSSDTTHSSHANRYARSVTSSYDIVQQAGGPNRAVKREAAVPVADGFLSIKFSEVENSDIECDPKVSGIEVKLTGTHYSHAVPGGPYFAVDVDGNGVQTVRVDGSESHTHGPDNFMVKWVWKKGATVLATGEVATLTLSVGEHTITLVATDNSGDANGETTTVTILPSKYPSVSSLSPVTGDVAGGTKVTISGSAFGSATAVRFGQVMLTGKDITVVNDSTITVLSPVAGVGLPVSVSIITPVGESGTLTFQYVGKTPVSFTIQKLMAFIKPTAVAFGPERESNPALTSGTSTTL
jgi:IPT/TIG domain